MIRSDPAVLEYHVLLMKLGGIDGVIVDWYGQDNYYDYLSTINEPWPCSTIPERRV